MKCTPHPFHLEDDQQDQYDTKGKNFLLFGDFLHTLVHVRIRDHIECSTQRLTCTHYEESRPGSISVDEIRTAYIHICEVIPYLRSKRTYFEIGSQTLVSGLPKRQPTALSISDERQDTINLMEMSIPSHRSEGMIEPLLNAHIQYKIYTYWQYYN